MAKPNTPDARNERAVDPKKYQEALAAFLTALEIEDDTTFEVIAGPSETVVKHVQYTVKDNGVHSGDFWEEVITRGNRGRNN